VIPVFALALAAAPAARGACNFANDEIVNPFDPGCGDVLLTYTESDDTGNNIALGYPVPVPVDSLTPVDGFRSYTSLFARHQALLMMHDEVDGQVVGQTVADRDIWAYRLGDADTTTADGFPEAAVLVNGGIHAREWQTPEAVTGLMESMVDDKADGGFGQYLIENLVTVLLPVNNVDGFLQTQRFADRTTADRLQPRDGRMRRKNMRNPETQGAIDEDLTTVADNFWGVDLNRNSSAGFAQSGRSSASVTSLIYRGTAPATEPEIQALQAAATLGPAARLRFYSDTHSFGQVYFAPTTGNARRNDITTLLAARMRAASQRGYAYAPDPAGSPGIGSTADHFAFEHQVPSWNHGTRAGEWRPGLRWPRHAWPQRFRAAGARGRTHARGRGADAPARVLSPGGAASRARGPDPRSPERRDRLRHRLAGVLRHRAHPRHGHEPGAGPGPRLPTVGRVQQTDADTRRRRQRRRLPRPGKWRRRRHRHARDPGSDRSGPVAAGQHRQCVARCRRRRARWVPALSG
jgi:hypothetical protein